MWRSWQVPSRLSSQAFWAVSWLGCFLLTIWAYWPAREAGFISDFTGHQMLFASGAHLGWWNSFGWHGNQPVLFGLMSEWYKLVGIQPLPWFLLFCGWHALNATLVGLLGLRVWRSVWPADARIGAAVVAILFLLHPYQTEVVVWKVCLHYLLSTTALLSMLLLLMRPRPVMSWPGWVLFYLLFLLALLSLELALIYPAMLLVTLWWWAGEEGWARRDRWRWTGWIVGPQMAMIGVYLLVNRWRMGAWLGHYGDDVHLRFSLTDLMGNAWQYLVKYIAFSRDWPHGWKEAVVLVTRQYSGVIIILVAIVLFFWIGWLVRGSGRKTGTLLWAGLLFGLALAPVLSLYVAWMGHVENDRYGYLASVFFLLAMQSLLLRGPRWLMLAAWLIWGSMEWICLQGNIDRWAQSNRLYISLLDDWRWTEETDIYVLGIPENYQGLFLFRSFIPGETLRDGLTWTAGKAIKGRIHEVAAFQVAELSDGLEVARVDDRTFDIRFRQWGNWFLRKGIGASDYRQDGYEVDFHEGGYRITFDEADPHRVMIYSNGGQWVEVAPGSK